MADSTPLRIVECKDLILSLIIPKLRACAPTSFTKVESIILFTSIILNEVFLLIISTNSSPVDATATFGFYDDPDALGFGDLNDSDIGGNFAKIIT